MYSFIVWSRAWAMLAMPATIELLLLHFILKNVGWMGTGEHSAVHQEGLHLDEIKKMRAASSNELL